MSSRIIEEKIYFFDVIPDEFKTQEMFEKVVETRPTLFFEYVPDRFVTPKMVELCKNATAAEKEPQERRAKQNRALKLKTMACIEAYKQRKAKKTKIKEELLTITWHPNRVFDWCFSEDEKKVH